MKYIANPVEADAYVIEKISPIIDSSKMELKLSEIGVRFATPAMIARYTPTVGDYFVIQEDGYVYLNPKSVFERKYRPAPGQDLQKQHVARSISGLSDVAGHVHPPPPPENIQTKKGG